MLGFIVGVFVLLFLMILIIGGIVSNVSKPEDVVVKNNSVLELDLSYAIPEKTENNPFKNISMGSFKPTIELGMNDIIKNIEKAKEDANIKGIYLDFGYFPSGSATAEQIRMALLDFKTSKKFIIAYAEIYTQKAYYVASVADKIYLNPKGLLEFRGLNAKITFFKNMLDKVGVEPQIFYCGKYKTATEPFRTDRMSDANKVMTSQLINNIQDFYVKNIASSRNLEISMVDSIADNLLIQTAFDAVMYKMIDNIYYEDQVLNEIKTRLALKEKDKVEFVAINKYDRTPDNKKKKLDDAKIAILYAQGDIIDGKAEEGQIGSETLCKQLVKLREDDKIKAVVFRVNSGGGSALASDIIWREVNLLKAKKPVVVSMGDYAASGGYYISCNASKIVAMPNTLTGSIGVFGILPNVQKLMNEKLGITFDGVSTGKYSDLGDLTRMMREDEKFIIQKGVDSIYYDFKYCVSKGRNIPIDLVDSIAQGRVWTGEQAVANGLVDTLGNLNTAIGIAAKLAKLKAYRITEYPQNKEDNFSKILSAIADKEDETYMRSKLGMVYPYYQQMLTISKMKGVQARIPFALEIE